MTHLVVTGGLGFIGSNFIRRISKSRRNLRIINLDYQGPSSNLQSLSYLKSNPNYVHLRRDIADQKSTERIIRDADFLVNFAAETHVDRSISNPNPFLHSNLLGTYRLLETSRKVGLEKFVHVSTDEVYGSIWRGSFTEDSPPRPSSPYSATKAGADLLALAWFKTYGLPVVVLRSTNNFGPYQHPEKFIPKTIIRAIRKMRIPLYGGGSQVRDWIYVDDFCLAVEKAISKGEPGEVYNISAGNEMPNREIAERILRMLGRPPSLLVKSEDRPGHDFRYSLSSRKARKHLGWTPSRSFNAALRSTVEWYSQNRQWWVSTASSKALSRRPWKESW